MVREYDLALSRTSPEYRHAERSTQYTVHRTQNMGLETRNIQHLCLLEDCPPTSKALGRHEPLQPLNTKSYPHLHLDRTKENTPTIRSMTL